MSPRIRYKWIKWIMILIIINKINCEPCDWMTDYNDNCIYNSDCTETALRIQIWEDCSAGSYIFTVSDTVTLGDDCDYVITDGTKISLKNEFDAETVSNAINCDNFLTGEPTLFFEVLDINEFAPLPDTGTTFQIEPPEEEPPGVITTIKYTDQDVDETQTLKCEIITTQFSDQFSLTPKYDDSLKANIFTLETKKSLDFEDMMYYNLQYDIISEDGKGNIISTVQTILVAVKDVSDNPPYWVDYYPSFQLDEGEADRDVFTVEARDRDVMIENDIRYFLEEDIASEYFQLDEISGLLKTIKEIDREQLLEENLRSFTLNLIAVEYDGNEPAIPQSNRTQASVINIMDINNKIPTFNKEYFELTIDELNSDSTLLINVFVFDMDEGLKGSYQIDSSDTVNLEVTPSYGSLNQSVTLTAKYRGENNIFNYELKKDEPIIFTITATEEEDETHIGQTTINITLKDINDNPPIFTQESYQLNVSEITQTGELLITVSATDDDITPDFSTESIVYSLNQQCQELEINPQSGDVSLKGSFDYEGDSQMVQCTAVATDEGGDGLTGVAEIAITILDAVDEPPELYIEPMEITENSATGETVGNVTVNDLDNGASISLQIDWDGSSASLGEDDVEITEDMKNWFKVSDVASMGEGEYSGSILVATISPDRETADTVSLRIIATDDATESGIKKDTGSAIISILDVSDEDPVFFSWCQDVYIDENSDDDTVVCTIDVGDPDSQDTLTIDIETNPYFNLEMTEIETISGESFPIKILVSLENGAIIDRESMENVKFDVTLTDKDGRTNKQMITIGINDKNDEIPIIIGDLCNSTQSIYENREDGFLFFNVMATDGDVTEPFNSVSYRLQNLNMPGDKNRYCPFNINSTTGQVYVDMSKGNKVDREMFADWELYFAADDSCGDNPDSDCVVLISEDCTVYVDVLDMNDEEPGELEWTPDGQYIEVDEFMMKDDIATAIDGTKYKIFGHDGDDENTDNTKLTYTVIKTTLMGSDDDLGLFREVNEEGNDPKYYCLLQATEDFYGQDRRGDYNIHIYINDHGDPMLNSTEIIPLRINDANDNTPEFVFGGCLDPDNATITMTENYYEPFEDIVCDTQNPEDEMEISVIDNDKPPNNIVEVKIIPENSTAVIPDGEEGQLSAFVIEPKEGDPYSFRLYVTETIDREKGSEYNLYLHVQDSGTPSLQSYRYLKVIIEDETEFSPYFCDEEQEPTPCLQTLFMLENDTAVSADFKAAIDCDNPEGVPPVEQVFYHIMDGNTGVFELIDNTETRLTLINKPDGLDREIQSNYTLTVVTSNINLKPPTDYDLTGNDTLKITIQVQDINDNPPNFDTSELFASFMETDTLGNKVADIQAFDLDLNETLYYTLSNDFTWHDIGPDSSSPPTDEPFKLRKEDDFSSSLLLNFQPTGVSQGYCTFTVNVKDKGEGKGSMGMKVYAMTTEFLVPTYFYNSVSQLQQQQDYITQVFSQTLGYPCIIDSISKYDEENQKSSPKNQKSTAKTEQRENLTRFVGKSTRDSNSTSMVLMHFIDPVKNEPVKHETITDLINNQQTVNQLVYQLGLNGLNLLSVYYPPTEDQIPGGDEDIILTLKILLGVVSLVLGLLVVLLGTIYCLRTRSLERKIKVLSTNTFGSQGSGLDEAGTGKVPGSNMFTGQGANPMYNMPDDTNINDNSSMSSGDSVLVGVEDNPEFRGMKTGIDNPSFNSPTPHSNLNGGPKSNPLLQLDDIPQDMDLSGGPSSIEMSVRAPSPSITSSEGGDSIPVNENFSFAKF